MILPPMRFGDYTWPHNPRVCSVTHRRIVAEHKVPFGLYALQSTGRACRVLSGEGEFAGAGAYEEFRKLAAVFDRDEPAMLDHPVWGSARAWFESLTLRQEPAADFVAYAFRFMDCGDGENAALTPVSAQVQTVVSRTRTLKAGESVWTVAAEEGLSIASLIAANPHVKNLAELTAGDSLMLEVASR